MIDSDEAARFDRRGLLTGLLAASATAVAVGPRRRDLLALTRSTLRTVDYGALGPPDRDGIRVPAGFNARVVARTGALVDGTELVWHGAPDGGGCIPRPGGGYAYVSNSELPGGRGGASVLVFDDAGSMVSARRILDGTSMNCAGGVTPWGTWLSCEEVSNLGHVWECDPAAGPAVERPALGSYRHEAVAVDGARRQLFLTEDEPDGRLYRFRPEQWPDLSVGVLEAASVMDGSVVWSEVRDDEPARGEDTTGFDGGEGIVIDGSSLLFATKGDRRIWEIDLEDDRISIVHDCLARPDLPLTHVDNLAVHPTTRALFVAEDGGDMDLCMLVRAGAEPTITRVVRFEGHDGSEVAGPSFSPDGRRLYLSSQRGRDGRGMTIEVEGPFDPWIRALSGGVEVRSGAVRLGNRAPSPGP